MPKLFKLDINMLKKTEGWIWKKGGINNGGLRRRNWKKRWFVFSPLRNDKSATITYYKAEKLIEKVCK